MSTNKIKKGLGRGLSSLIGENKSDLEEFNAKKFIDRILKN